MVRKSGRKLGGLSLFIGIFVLGMLGVVFLQSIADTTTGVTTTLVTTNASVAATAVNSTADLNGKAVTSFIAYNRTGNPAYNNKAGFNSTRPIASGNYTLTDNILDSSGTHTAQYKTADNGFVGALNVSYNYEPIGYVSNSAGRSLVNLIIVIFAIGLVLFIVARIFNSEGARRILSVGAR